MIRIKVAFPVFVLLFALSIPSAGQTFFDTPDAAVAPRVAQSQPQSPTDSSVIVVKPGLTDEQLARQPPMVAHRTRGLAGRWTWRPESMKQASCRTTAP